MARRRTSKKSTPRFASTKTEPEAAGEAAETVADRSPSATPATPDPGGPATDAPGSTGSEPSTSGAPPAHLAPAGADSDGEPDEAPAHLAATPSPDEGQPSRPATAKAGARSRRRAPAARPKPEPRAEEQVPTTAKADSEAEGQTSTEPAPIDTEPGLQPASEASAVGAKGSGGRVEAQPQATRKAKGSGAKGSGGRVEAQPQARTKAKADPLPEAAAEADTEPEEGAPPAGRDPAVVTAVPDDDEVASPVSPARFGESGRGEAGSRPQGMSRQRAIRSALASLPVPSPGPSFWADLDAALVEQESFAITARPAIRPISEPPPLSQPRPGERLPSGSSVGTTPRPHLAAREMVVDDPGKGRRNVVVVVAVAIIAALLVLSSALGQDDDEAPSADGPTTTAADETDRATPTSEPSTTTPSVPGLEPDTRLTSAGLGPLRIGLRGRDLEEEGVQMLPDDTTFQGSGGRCFDVHVLGASDLVLRFRSGDPRQGVDDPMDGVLAAISVTGERGSLRVTDAGLGIGAPAQQVLDAYGDAVQTSPHPSGQVHVVGAADGSGNGLAYVTDGRQVVAINVGSRDVVPQPDICA